MLDAIHLKFTDKKDFFNRLIDKENPIITFLFLNLKEFKLTDDLYIKMNARGMPLTTFENFKTNHFSSLTNDGIDLLKKMLIYDPTKRITTKEALNHEFFLDSNFFLDSK